MRKIGLLGGTFDPVHFGHLRLAEQCQQKLDLEEIWFIPLPIRPIRTGRSVLMKNGESGWRRY